MASSQQEADIINAERRRQADYFRRHLEQMGVTCSVASYTGDSSYPTEYTLTYSQAGKRRIEAIGPTFDMALMEFVEKLLKEVW